jgi:hypothetical protein
MPGPYYFTDSDGRTFSVATDEDAATERRIGSTPASADQVGAYDAEKAAQSRESGAQGALDAFVSRAAAVPSFGLSTLAAKKMLEWVGGPEEAAQFERETKAAEAQHPIAAVAGDIAGLAPGAVAGAAKYAAGKVGLETAAEVLGRVAEAAPESAYDALGNLVGSKVAAAAAGRGFGSVAQGTLAGTAKVVAESEAFSAGHVVHEQALGDPRDVGEALVAEAGPAALFGVALGAPLGAASGLMAKLGEEGVPIGLVRAQALFGGKQAAAGGGKDVWKRSVADIGEDATNRILNEGPDVLGTTKTDGARQILEKTNALKDRVGPQMVERVTAATESLPVTVVRDGLNAGDLARTAKPEFRSFLQEARQKVLQPMLEDATIPNSARRVETLLDTYEARYINGGEPTLMDLWKERQILDDAGRYGEDVKDVAFSRAARKLRGLAEDALTDGIRRADAGVAEWNALKRQWQVAELYSDLANEGVGAAWDKKSLATATGLGFFGTTMAVHSLGGGLVGAGLTAAGSMAARRYGWGLLNFAARRLRSTIEGGALKERPWGAPPIPPPAGPGSPPSGFTTPPVGPDVGFVTATLRSQADEAHEALSAIARGDRVSNPALAEMSPTQLGDLRDDLRSHADRFEGLAKTRPLTEEDLLSIARAGRPGVPPPPVSGGPPSPEDFPPPDEFGPEAARAPTAVPPVAQPFTADDDALWREQQRAEKETALRAALAKDAEALGIPEDIRKEAVEVAATQSASQGPNVSTIITPQRPNGETFRYRIIDAGDMVQSHRIDGFAPNPEYPEGVQTRNYQGDKAEREKIEAPTGGRFNPDFVLANVPEATTGAPIITAGPKSIVLGGNGRTMMLKRAFRNQAQFDEYQRALRERLSSYGLTEDDLAGIRRPVLVREVELTADSPLKDLQDAVHRYNSGLTQELRPAEKYAAMARTLSPEVMGRIGDVLAENGEASLREIMASDPGPIIGILNEAGLINRVNRRAYVTDGGALTDLAKDDIEGMFRARVLGEGDRAELTTKEMKRKIERIAPYLIRVAATNPELDEIPMVQEAIDRLNSERARLREVKRAGGIDSLDMLRKSPPPGPADALGQLLENTGSVDLQQRFKAWADAASGERKQVGLFGVAPPSQQDLRKILSPEYAAAPVAAAALMYQPQNEHEQRVADDTAALTADERRVAMTTAMHDQSGPFPTASWALGATPDQLPAGPVTQNATGRPEAFRLLGTIRQVLDRQEAQLQSWASTLVRAGAHATDMGRGALVVGLPRSLGDSMDVQAKRYAKETQEANRLASDPSLAAPRLASAVGDLDEHAPSIAQEARNTMVRAAQFLASKTPAPLGLGPFEEPFPPSRQEMASWSIYREAIESPMDLLRWAAAGTLMPEHVEAVGAVYGSKLEAMQQAVIEQVGRHGTPPISQWTAIDTLMGRPMFRSPESTLASAMVYASQAAQRNAVRPPAPRAARRSGKMALNENVTGPQRISAGSTSPEIGAS